MLGDRSCLQLHHSTPNWNWHDHNNYGGELIVWFDKLDVPLVATLESILSRTIPTSSSRCSAMAFWNVHQYKDASRADLARREPYEERIRTYAVSLKQ